MDLLRQKALPIERIKERNFHIDTYDEKQKIKQLKAQKYVKIAFENDKFITYTYKVENAEISVNFNSKPLIEWSKEQLKGVIRK